MRLSGSLLPFSLQIAQPLLGPSISHLSMLLHGAKLVRSEAVLQPPCRGSMCRHRESLHGVA